MHGYVIYYCIEEIFIYYKRNPLKDIYRNVHVYCLRRDHCILCRCDNVQCGCIAYECSIKLRKYMRDSRGSNKIVDLPSSMLYLYTLLKLKKQQKG